MDDQRPPGPVHPARLADHLRRHHPRRNPARRPQRTARPLSPGRGQRPAPSVKTDGTQTFLTPEGLGGVRHRYATGASSEPSWRAWGGYPSEPHWTARFSFGTPTMLVAAFTASLISTEPLRRTVQDVPTQTRRALYVATATGRQPHSNPSVAPLPPAPASGHTR
ncbi:DUF317 domain-containing protein [Streptomyces sp. ICN988]|uniref:DUF317 domain-containing protein n=1 Tax=Streptomyces sp. ICN988 TaxID=2983765 RepID=UPI0021E4E9DA|nr:DUF317 domain-containing protein [Streptomyces sp. ICN988]MCV2463951.1 DUF317 domain-containing protein [Streptomyces sp. ICN988]